MRRSLVLMIIGILCFSMLQFVHFAKSATTIIVPDDYSTIQEAINAAWDGDTIFVRSGTYPAISIDKSLNVVGENKYSTTIDGGGSFGIYVGANNVLISNFTIQHGRADLYIGNRQPELTLNITIMENIMKESGDDGNIRLVYTTGVSLIHNLINGGGIGFDWANDSIICNNTITEGNIGGGYPSFNNTFSENTVTGSNVAITFNNVFSNNRFFHNNFISSVKPQVQLTSGSNCWDKGYSSGGNYWSDYNGSDLYSGSYQNETGSDNIGDSPYVIDANNQDNYPLMRPYVQFENQTICIRADGSIDPSGAPLLRRGDLYTLADNIISNTNGIVIERDGIALDGAECTLQGLGIGCGIELDERTNVTIQNMQIRTFDYGIGLGFSSLNTISNNNVTTCHCGIDLGFSHGNIVSGNTVTGTLGYASIHLVNSANNSIFGNNVTANWCDGILLYSSSNNLVSGNNLSANGNIGIEISGSSYPFGSYYNTISGNDVSFNNWAGICISHSSNDSIFENKIAANSAYGISLWSSSDNVIFHNNFENNTQQADIDPASMNSWDNGYPSGGNYWSDCNSTDFYWGIYQNETGSDGIGDSPYVIDSTNLDSFPLMKPYSGFHDIGITLLNLSKTVVGKGYCANLSSTVINYGEGTETFNTTLTTNGTGVQTQNVSLSARNSVRIPFVWNTTDFAYGSYILSADAEPVLGETDLTDNNCTCSFPVHVGVPGDISGPTQGIYDGKCNMRDINYLIAHFNSKPSSPNWNPNADVNGDNTVNMRDIQMAILNFNRHE